MQIQIVTDLVSSEELKNDLQSQLGETEEIALEVHSLGEEVRGVIPTVVVALVAAGGTALGALIAGLFKIMEVQFGRKIVIAGAKGTRIELTGKFTKEEIDDAVRRAREIDPEQIFLK